MKCLFRFFLVSLFCLNVSASLEREGKEKSYEKTAQEKIAEIDVKLKDVYSRIIDLNCIPHSSQAVLVEQELANLYTERKDLEDQREALTSSSDLEKYDNAC